MDNKTNLKSVVAFSLIGYICVLGIRYIQGILSSVINILGLVLNINSDIYVFLDILPEVIILVFWLLIIFKYLNRFYWSETFSIEITRKFAIRLGISVFALFILLGGIRYLENYVLAETQFELSNKWKLTIINTYILSLLNVLEVLLIVLGLIRLLNKKNLETKDINEVESN